MSEPVANADMATIEDELEALMQKHEAFLATVGLNARENATNTKRAMMYQGLVSAAQIIRQARAEIASA